MHIPQNLEEYQQPAKPPETADLAFIPNTSNFSPPPTTIGNTVYNGETSAQQEYILITLGKQLATRLAEVLDQLSAYNKEAIDPIVAIIEPYIETSRDLDINIPPKSSREIVIEITREGRIPPKIYLDESL